MVPVRQIAVTAAAAWMGVLILSGCASDTRPRDVPNSATLSTEGTGRIAFTAPQAGMAYVYNDSADQMIYSTKMERGQKLSVDVKNDRIDLDNAKASEQTLHTGDRYQIYFDPHGTVVRQTVIEERRVTQ